MASMLDNAGRALRNPAARLTTDDPPFGPDDVVSASCPATEPRWSHAAPPNVDAMSPGPIVAAWLSAVDVEAVAGLDRVAVMRAHHRLATHFAALAYRDMLAIHDLIADEDAHGDPVDVGLATEAEIRAAMRWSRRFTESELRFALDLRDRHPAVFVALERGSIDVPRARAIDRGTCHLPLDVATRIGASLVDEAGDLTVGELLDRVRKLVIAVEPDEAERRFAEAHDRRRVVLEPTVDGTANVLGMDLAPHDAAAVRRRIQRLAKHASAAGDERTAEQVRADLVDLYCSVQQPLPDEHRAFWCHSAFGVSGMEWDEAIRILAENGFTAILPNMLWGGGAYYASDVLPPAARTICAPLPGFNSTQWTRVPTGILRIGSALPGLIGACWPD